VLTTVAIFAPSFLLLMGTLPFWDAFRARTDVRAALQGINAAVVGILLAALYTPVWTSAIKGPADVSLTIVALGLLMLWKRPPWLVVLVAALGGAALAVVR
jgi:chromate transporter